MRRLPLYDIVILLIVLLAGLPGLFWAYAGERGTTLAADALPVMLPASGLYEPEPLADRPEHFRWTNGAAEIELPNPGGRLAIELSLASGFETATSLTVEAVGSEVALMVLPGLHSYSLLLPPQPGERVGLRLSSPVSEVDGRALGVMLHKASIAGGGSAPLAMIGALLFAGLGAFLLLRRAGLGALVAGAITLGMSILAALWIWAGVWAYGLLGQLLMLAGVAAFAALLIERIWPPLPPEPAPQLGFSRADWLALAGLIGLALILCLPWLGAPDPVGDLELSARRMGFMVEGGLSEAFSYGGDYMPLRLYILRLLAELVPLLGGAYYEPLPAVTRAIIKLPSLAALLLSVGLIFGWARRYRGTRGAALIAGLYAVAPPVWMNVAWWGQVDVLLSLPMVAAVALLDRARGRWAWLCWAAGLLIKPQAIILAPLIYAATLRRYGPRGLVEGAGLAAGLIVAACAPFALIGQGPGLYQAAAGSVGRFPQVTNRAYNLWWLVAGDAAVSDLTSLGSLSYRSLGLLLVGVAALLVMLAVLRRPDGPARAAGAAALALAFFALPTQIHERYAFFALPFLLLLAAADGRALLPFGLLTATATINIVGAIRGFFPAAHAAIRASPLPEIVAWASLATLAGLLAYAWLNTSRQNVRQPTLAPAAAPPLSPAGEREGG